MERKYNPRLVGEVRWATTGAGCLLKIIGRKRVVLRADKRLEESPGPPRSQAQRSTSPPQGVEPQGRAPAD